MKKTKMFYGNQHIGSFRVTGERLTRLQRAQNAFKRALALSAKVCIVMWLMVISAGLYHQYFPKVVMAQNTVTVQVPVDLDIPILDKIIQCESGGKQFDKNGQVLMNINVQQDGAKSVDEGIGQINVQTWGATASNMGYNLAIEKDNMAFTKWLFLNKGSGPWSASSKCWNK